ncbi:MAG: type II toxin-antitoxin system VapC family toxin [Candidatus Thorarchaeota archaeon]
MKTLLDTNILVHAHNQSSPQQKKASEILRDAIHSRLDAYIIPQILYEFFSVVTNSRRVDKPLATNEAFDICKDLWVSSAIKIIEPQSSTTLVVFDLVRNHGIAGAQIFDYVIAATAKEHGIERIFTENTRDFAVFDFLKVVNPLR